MTTTILKTPKNRGLQLPLRKLTKLVNSKKPL
nr:MAG TPA: hypothetical protein [Caudoviricetes sp.]